jgi:hypothetical protein
MFVESGIYRKADNIAGSILEFFNINALDDLADENESKVMNYGREKIKGELEQLKKFHHSHNQ